MMTELEPVFDVPTFSEEPVRQAKVKTPVLQIPELGTEQLFEAVMSLLDFADDEGQRFLGQALSDMFMGRKNFGRFTRLVKELAQQISGKLASRAIKSSRSPEALALVNAYYDVARYQTDVTDATLQWGLKNDYLLQQILDFRPPPITPENRAKLRVPKVVRALREVA
jgi:hypothetical protein